MLSLINKETIILNAYGKTIDSTNINHNKQIKLEFPSSIVLKENMFVELIHRNYNIQDGLVNGAEGIFIKSIAFENGAISIKFIDPVIGTIQREKMVQFYKDGIISTWTPVIRVCRNNESNNKIRFIGEPIPIQLTCA